MILTHPGPDRRPFKLSQTIEAARTPVGISPQKIVGNSGVDEGGTQRRTTGDTQRGQRQEDFGWSSRPGNNGLNITVKVEIGETGSILKTASTQVKLIRLGCFEREINASGHDTT